MDHLSWFLSCFRKVPKLKEVIGFQACPKGGFEWQVAWPV